jgi:hypothetical protein
MHGRTGRDVVYKLGFTFATPVSPSPPEDVVADSTTVDSNLQDQNAEDQDSMEIIGKDQI